MMKVTEKPDVTYADIGGLEIQKQEIHEAIELPLSHPELYAQIGITRRAVCSCTAHPAQAKQCLRRRWFTTATVPSSE